MAFSLMGILSVLLEVVRPFLPLLLILILADAILLLFVLKRIGRGLRFAAAFRVSWVLGLIVGVVAAFLAPLWSWASLGQLSPMIDYLAIFAIALGGTVVATLALYPPLQLVVGSRS